MKGFIYGDITIQAQLVMDEIIKAGGLHLERVMFQSPDWNSLLPLDAALIEGMRKTEVIALRMMDQYSQNAILSWSYSRRKSQYLEFLRYWNHQLTVSPPDFCLGFALPHTVSDFVLVRLCQQKQIPVYFFNETLPDSTLLLRDWEHSSARSREDALEDSVTPRLKFVQKLMLQRHVQRIAKVYRKHEYRPNVVEKYFYFPLRLQSDLVATPLADVFADQVLAAQMVSAALPAGVSIFVREHSEQDLKKQSPYLYSSLSKIPNLKLVPRKLDEDELIQGSLGVATVGGRVGWRALKQGKSLLLFGHEFYQNCRGTYRIRNETDAKHAINKILSEKQGPALDKTSEFVSEMTAQAISTSDIPALAKRFLVELKAGLGSRDHSGTSSRSVE